MVETDLSRILDSLKDNLTGEVDVEKFVDRLFFEQDNRYLNEFQQSFKNNFFLPVSEKFKTLYVKTLDKLVKSENELSKFDEKEIKTLSDPFGFKELKKEYKEKIENVKKQLDKTLNVENFSLEDDEDKNDNNFLSAIKNSLVSTVFPEPRNVSPIKENKKTGADLEQKGFGNEIVIEFSPRTQDFLQDLFLNKFLTLFFKKLPKQTSFTPTQSSNWMGLGTLGTIIAGIISDIIYGGRLLKDAFIAVKNFFLRLVRLPGDFVNFLKNEGIYGFRDLKAWFQLRWEKYVTEPLKKWFPFLEDWGKKIGELKETVKQSAFSLYDDFVKRLEVIKTNIKEAIKYDDFLKRINEIKVGFDNFIKGVSDFGKRTSTVFDDFVLKPVSKVWDFFKWMGGGIGNFFKDLFKMINGEEILKSTTNMFKGLFEWITSFKGPLQYIADALKPIVSKISAFAKFLGPIVLLLDPIIGAFRGIAEIWGDENLSMLQKGVVILTGFVTGLADIVYWIIDIISKGITGIWNFFVNGGWVTDNSVSTWIKDKLYLGGNSLSGGATKAVADLQRDYNKGVFDSSKEKSKPEGRTGELDAAMSRTEPVEAQTAQKAPPSTPTVEVEDFMTDKAEVIESDGVRFKLNKNPSNPDVVTAMKKDGGLDKLFGKLTQVMIDVKKEIVELKNVSLVSQASNNIAASNASVTINNAGASSESIMKYRSKASLYHKPMRPY